MDSPSTLQVYDVNFCGIFVELHLVGMSYSMNFFLFIPSSDITWGTSAVVGANGVGMKEPTVIEL